MSTLEITEMQKFIRGLLFAAITAGVASSPAFAGELTITMAEGRVTVIAQDVPLRQILAEWARVGNTKMVHAEKLTGGPLTLQLVDMPEKEALDILLRSAAGYLTAPRPTPVAGASLYDRVIILATSKPPASVVSPAPPPFARPAMPQPLPQPPPDDDGDPGDQGPNAPPGAQGTPGVAPPGFPPFPGPNPGMPPGATPPNQGPMTSPRPGMLPQPQPQPNQPNPYAPIGPNGRPIPGPTGRGGGPPGPGGPPGTQDR
jgi:hypothetical protein